MKKSLFCVVSFLVLVFFLTVPTGEGAPQCNFVAAKAVSCVRFTTGKDKTPSSECCAGLQQLVQTVKSVDDKKAICRCLKASAKALPGMQDGLLAQIPKMCGIKVGFPVSINTNCETIR